MRYTNSTNNKNKADDWPVPGVGIFIPAAPAKTGLVYQIGQKLKDWYYTSASTTYVPNLTIGIMDDKEEGNR
jgi:hypothetical protein